MKYCNRPFDSLYCMPDGNVSFCGWTNATIGNILNDDLENIWNSELAERVRESIKDGSYRYCRKVSCPYCENDNLPEISMEDLENKLPEEAPTYYEIANDIICNHNCPSCREHVFCVSEEYKEKLKKQLDILTPLVNKADRVSVNGGGELFASPVMLEFLENLKPEKEDFKLGIQTNGALFNEKNWNRISHLGKYYINVTVTPNSFVRETYEYLSGFHNDFDKTIQNLYFIKQLREQNIINSLKISIVVQDRNFCEVPEFAKRCIDDFKADSVVIKPLYKWFYMSEEMYWFKDVLNPSHPYHREWLKILENPILENPKVYMWGAKNLHENKPHPAYKYKELLEVARQLNVMDNIRERLEDEIKKLGYKEIIIYGDNELTDIILSILSKGEISVKCILARDMRACSDKMSEQRDKADGISIVKLDSYEFCDNELILISNFADRKFIERDLSFKGYKGKITDIKELVTKLREEE